MRFGKPTCLDKATVLPVSTEIVLAKTTLFVDDTTRLSLENKEAAPRHDLCPRRTESFMTMSFLHIFPCGPQHFQLSSQHHLQATRTTLAFRSPAPNYSGDNQTPPSSNLDKYTNKPLPMTPLPLRSSSCKDIEKSLPLPTFPQRSTSLPRVPSTSAPVSEGLETLPATTYVPLLINKQLPPLPASAYAPPSPTEKLTLLPATTYVPPKTSKELPTLPATNHSRKLSNAIRISNNPSNLSLVDPKSVTLDTPLRASSPFSLPSHPSPPLRKKACRSPLLPPDEVEVKSLVLVTVQPLTPGTAPSSVPTSAPKEVKNVPRIDAKKRRKSRLSATRSRSHQSMLLSSHVAPPALSSPRKSFYRGSKKLKHESFTLYGKSYRTSYRQSRAPDLPRVDTRKSIFHLIKRPEAKSLPPSVPERTFEQMYLQILEERWAYYRQLDAMREADEKREVEEYLAAHPIEPAPSPPSVPACAPSSVPPSGRRSARQTNREARDVRKGKIPAIPESKPMPIVTKTTTVRETSAEKRLTVSSPRLFSSPRSPRERLQQEEQELKSRWREWLKSGRKDEMKDQKMLAKEPVEKEKSTEDELGSISTCSDAGLRFAFG